MRDGDIYLSQLTHIFYEQQLPAETALHIFSYLDYLELLQCSAVCKRWHALASDDSLWKTLCNEQGWLWRDPSDPYATPPVVGANVDCLGDDEGMGEEVEEEDSDSDDEMDLDDDELSELSEPPEELEDDSTYTASQPSVKPSGYTLSHTPLSTPPNHKLLHLTQSRIRCRIYTSNYRLHALQTRGAPDNSHCSTIYCIQLYTDPHTGLQTLFSGSKDRTVREWDLSTGTVKRVLSGVHESSVLSLCAAEGYIASGGSDKKVAVFSLDANTNATTLVGILQDHQDGVLGVRFMRDRLVSCSKDHTIRMYTFPGLQLVSVMTEHRAAVNAIALSPETNAIISVSGDRSVRIWDWQTGELLKTLQDYHGRGIAAIDVARPLPTQYQKTRPRSQDEMMTSTTSERVLEDGPVLLTGSSDRHIRVYDLSSREGWSTGTSVPISQLNNANSQPAQSQNTVHVPHQPSPAIPICTCPQCTLHRQQPSSSSSHPLPPPGSPISIPARLLSRLRRNAFPDSPKHTDLVRSVSLGHEFVISGSYDLSIKVWSRSTGALVADLTGGHTGRIFCVVFDGTKIVSCGEDQRICVWDFGHGMNLGFIKM